MLTILGFFAHQPLHIEPATVALTGAAWRCSSHDRPRAGALEDRMADPVLLRRPVRHGRRAGSDGSDRTKWPTRRGPRLAATAPRSCWDRVDRRDRLGGRRQHSLHDRDDPGRRASSASGEDDAYWWALSLGACFGGNATIIAAARERRRGGPHASARAPIGFLNFLRIGIPVTIVSIALASAYVRLRYMVL